MTVATIGKEWTFEASHQLSTLPPEHQCSRVHGHSYVARLELTGPVSADTGFVVDYGVMAPFGQWIADNLDHRHINEALATEIPTAEVIAAELGGIALRVVPGLVEFIANGGSFRVGISETRKTYAWVGFAA